MQVYRGNTAVGNFVQIESDSPNTPKMWIGTVAELAAWDLLNVRDLTCLYITTDGAGNSNWVDFAPTVDTATGSHTIGVNSSKYIEIGKLVHFNIQLSAINVNVAPTGQLTIGGLPSTPDESQQFVVQLSNHSQDAVCYAAMSSGTSIVLQRKTAANASFVNLQGQFTGGVVHITGQYKKQ